MLVFSRVSTEEYDGELIEGVLYNILVPTNQFEGLLLKEHICLALEVELNNINSKNKKVVELGLNSKSLREELFDAIRDVIWYDKDGRFYFDETCECKYSNDKITFYITSTSETDKECCDSCEDRNCDICGESNYDFDVCLFSQGVLKSDLTDVLIEMLKSVATKNV